MKLKHKADILIAEGRKFFLLHPADDSSVNRYRTRIRLVERSHNLQQGGFSGTAGTDNTDDLSFIYFQINAFQHLQRAKTLGYSF